MSILGSVLFLFVFWKRLREDYSSEVIFESGSIFLALILLGYFLSLLMKVFLTESAFFNPEGLWFWGSLAGFYTAFLVSSKKYKLKQVEVLESGYLALSLWLLIVYLFNKAVLPLLILLIIYLLFFYFQKNYKRFGWYKSGRAGFSGLAAGGLFFGLRAALSLLMPETFSFIGKIDFLPSAVATFLFFFSLYNLSEDYVR